MLPSLVTVGHGTLGAEEFTALLRGAGIGLLVDVRAFPGSRRHPHFAKDAMSRWLVDGGVDYRWEPELGGRRRPVPDSPHSALRHSGFRAYADHMATPGFHAALDRVLAEAATGATAVMCAEALWWKCHRRLLADAAVLLRGATVDHLDHRGLRQPHAVTRGVRVEAGTIIYDAGESNRLPGV